MLAANWIIGLLLLSTMAIKLLWGADLFLSAYLDRPDPSWKLVKSGVFHLGMYFLMSAFFVYGAIGFLLMLNPYERVPIWFAIPCVFFTLECILAWHFLKPGHPNEGSYDSD